VERDSLNFIEASKTFLDCAVQFEKEHLAFWAAVSREYEAKSLIDLFEKRCKQELIREIKDSLNKSAYNYGLEAKIYEEKCCFLLAERAKADKSWCESQIEKLAVK